MKYMYVCWNITFNASLAWWGHISNAQMAAKFANYPYFCWNDVVYNTETLEALGIDNILEK